ncbi:molybdopterin molybdotransferase MoeA [Frigidibacter sp.]|uniref:molybdopterin molybdotransferase MoeA n=1 Tax=Frigidibacter sp. TaxID=2586418 RepID=UPI00273432B3|nr:molybdopterin molybdotransferase MoeA [Frigidibacter sp.]MDP3342677.1 molybdopterin molybdotransferase MoeA [Frigidibacter sp.]
MISVAEALARVLVLAPKPVPEQVALRAAAGRVLLHPAQAKRDQPPFAASAMDGYAILEADHVPGAVLTVQGEAGAGHGFSGIIAPGTAARIFTGAPVPQGAERVVLQEDVTREGDRIALGGKLEAQTHIRPQGADFRAGDALSAPRRLRPVELALLASMNLPELTVARRPEVAILATGDELVMPGEQPAPDQIVASNGFALAAMAEAAGAKVRMLPIARDNEASLRQCFALTEGADVIVTIGGASVGDHDLVGKVAADLGMERAFWKIAMRPGKPLMAGKLGGAVMLGLPGNPVSSIVCAHLFLLPLLAAMQGLPGVVATQRAVLAEDLQANGPRAHYMRSALEAGDGLPRITPFASQDSSRLRLLTEAVALLIRPAEDGPRAAGGVVEYITL